MQVSVYCHNATDMSPKTLFWEWLIVLFELCWCYLPTTGELYRTIKGYKAAEDDELTLQAGEMIEVIHKLLDGWWVVRYESTNFNFMVCRNNPNACSHLMIHNLIAFPNVWKNVSCRKGDDTGFFPSMFLCRTGEKKEVDAEKNVVRRETPPPRRYSKNKTPHNNNWTLWLIILHKISKYVIIFSFGPTDLPYAMPRASILLDVGVSVRTPIGDRADGSYSSEED